MSRKRKTPNASNPSKKAPRRPSTRNSARSRPDRSTTPKLAYLRSLDESRLPLALNLRSPVEFFLVSPPRELPVITFGPVLACSLAEALVRASGLVPDELPEAQILFLSPPWVSEWGEGGERG